MREQRDKVFELELELERTKEQKDKAEKESGQLSQLLDKEKKSKE